MASLVKQSLPVRLTPLVGRESELGDIVHALARSRLLTLTVPGGTGKTRLALAAANSAAGSFSGGVCWVELAQIDDPGIVGPTVASRLGVPDTPGQDVAEAIAEYVAERPVLIVLDNCEHLAGAAAGLAEGILAACPALVVLATSREALGVEGERNWPVPPLSLPAASLAPTASRLAHYDAVQLFEQRAQLVRPTFQVTDANAGAVLSICRRLDGLPLAIELAAARMRILSSAQLAERLGDMFSVLVGGARSAPPRHQALRATLDWSHDLLYEDERTVFRRLAPFAGGFTLHAAERAAASLERVEEEAGRLELDRLDAELPNLRRAFEIAQEQGEVPAAALRIAASLDRYAYLRGHYHEVRQWMDAAVACCPDAPATLRAKALLGSGRLALLQCDYAPAVRRLEAALRLYRELDDARGIASGLQVLGSVNREQGRYARSIELHAESLAVAWSVEQLGLLAAVDGDPAAISLLRRSLELHTELRDRWRMSSVLEDLAAIALAKENPAGAARLLGAAEAIRSMIGTVIAPCERLQHNQTTKTVRAGLGDVWFDAAMQQGAAATIDELGPDLPTAETPAPAATAPAEPTPAETAAAARSRAPQQAGRDLSGPLRIRTLGAAVVEFGEVAVTAADWGYAKPRELMFLLVSSPPMTKDQIAAALWPDLSRQQLGNALHTALRELRRALGDPGWVVYADGHYRFDRTRPHECDVTAFEDALAAARRARPAAAALPDLQRAIAAYGGDFLDGMSAGEWALIRRDELRRAFESALLATGRLQVAAGRHQAAAAAFRRAVAHEPLNESAHRELMACWVRLGETARAVRHYEELVQLLRDQVGVAPAAETAALYRKLTAAP